MLPPALLDLVSLRLSIRLKNATFINVYARGQIRYAQQLASQRNAPSPHNALPDAAAHPRGLHLQKVQQAQDQIQAVSELEARVAALKEASEQSILKQTIGSQDDAPYFSDTMLQDIYGDLLQYPRLKLHQPSDPVAVSAADILHGLRERLPEMEVAVQAQANSPEGLAARLQARVHQAPPYPIQESHTYKIDLYAKIEEDVTERKSQLELRSLIIRLRAVLEAFRTSFPGVEPEDTSSELKPAPFRLLMNAEWRALSEACLHVNDVHAAEAVLELMASVGLPPSDEQCDMVLSWYANRGLVEDADAHVAGFGLDVPRERQRDLLIKARLKAQQVDEACTLLHSFETRTHPAPMTSYTRVIQALLQQRGPGSSQHAAQAWDLFAHMRYVAHPVPDCFLYSTMIRASSEPERALDLFTEMTVEQRIVPDTYAYTAVIRACARSKEYAQHAFRIAREMLNSHRDAEGRIPAHLRPDAHIFRGLLEAAKRVGDLSRARWVLAEMAQGALDMETDGEQLVYVDEKALTHMFHVYATYKPPFRRGAVSLVNEETSQEGLGVEQPDAEEDYGPLQARKNEVIGLSGFRGLPQSRQEVLREATMLWERVIQDRGESQNSEAPGTVFGRVRLDVKLLNAYLAVYYVHAPPSESYRLYNTLYEELDIHRDPFAHVLALEAYARRKNDLPPREMQIALENGRKTWEAWSRLERGGEAAELYDVRGTWQVEPRLIERAWCAMMRLLTLSGKLDEAEDLLRRFVQRHPPKHVKDPTPFDPRRSNRTRLYDERPLVRLIEPSTVPEDRLPPFLTFPDIALLHSRALLIKNRGLLDFIKWAVSAYEGSLRYRRQAQARKQS